MKSSWNWFRTWDITIWIDILWSSSSLLSSKSSWLSWIVLLHNHSVWVSTSWNDHSSVGATSHDSSIMHDVLWEVLSDKKRKRTVSFQKLVTLESLVQKKFLNFFWTLSLQNYTCFTYSMFLPYGSLNLGLPMISLGWAAKSFPPIDCP